MRLFGRLPAAVFAAVFAAVVAACASSPLGAQSVPGTIPVRGDSTGTIVGVVTMKDGGFPLAYSVASVPALDRERFSNDAGIFVLGQLPAGVVKLRVKHLGYSPVDLAVTVHAGRADTVRVALVHIAVRLVTMEVHALPECRDPGAPRAAADSAFATIFDQLRQNAEQYRLLTATYPFVYSVERSLSNHLADGEVRTDVVDTVTLASRNDWRYAPGAIVTRDGSPRRPFRGGMVMNIPTLVNFADPVFLANHCFYNGGLETVDGTDLLRIDFTAASRIRDPDVNGVMYLDPTTFQIRRTIVRLSRIPRGLTGLQAAEAVTYFGELFPSIPVTAGIASVNRLESRGGRSDAITETHEDQRLLRVQFLKGLPGSDVRKP